MSTKQRKGGAEAVIDDKELNEALSKILDIVEMEQERDCVSNAELFDQLLIAFSSQMKAYLVPSSPEIDYVGVHLGQIYEDNDFDLLVKAFKNGQTLDAFYVMKIFNEAKERLKLMPNVRDCTIEDNGTPGEQSVIIVGDLHGNFHDLCHIMDKYGSPGTKHKFIFNGDFVDRGPKQIEVLLILLYAFLQYPNRVYLNRGNHEDITMNTNINFQPNFMSDMKSKYGKYSTALFFSAVELFAYLPLATVVINEPKNIKFFIVHGGISDRVDLDYVRNNINRFDFQRLIQYSGDSKYTRDGMIIADMLWSDPIRVENGKIKPKTAKRATGCYFNEQRNFGSLFGYDLTESFCKKYSFDGVIRSHEAREKGFSEDHSRCWTVFSASHYCNTNNMGAVFEYHIKDNKPRAYNFKTNELSAGGGKIMQKNHELIKQFKRLIQSNQSKLISQFRMFDLNKDGTIKTNVWAEILAKHFKNEISTKHLIHIKDLLCECENVLDTVSYKTLFSVASSDKSQRQQTDQNYMNVIINLFDLLDKNHDNKISSCEVKDALELINKKIGSKYSINDACVNFIKNMDQNGDNEIDLEEFKKAFFDINNGGENGAAGGAGNDELDDETTFGMERKVADSSDSSDNDDEIVQIVRL